VAVLARSSDLPKSAALLHDLLTNGDHPPGDAVAEVYVLVDEAIDDEAALASNVLAELAAADTPSLQRLVVAVVQPGAAEPVLLAFRREDGILQDDPLARG